MSDNSENINKGKSSDKRNKPTSIQNTHLTRKRCPPHLKTTNDIYITNKSNFKGQMTQCEKLLEKEEVIVLHGIGAAIPKTINLALQLNEKHQGAFELHVETSTVTLVDDLEPVTDAGDYETRTRQNSSVSVRVSKAKDCPVSQL